MRVFARRYPVPFRNDRAISAGVVGNFATILPQNWLPWQRPLRYRKMKDVLIICIQYLPYGANLHTLYPLNSGVNRPKFTKFLQDCCGIIAVVNTLIYTAILQFVLERQSKEWRRSI